MENQSLWRKDCEIPARHSLKHDLNVDVVVIGAGMAGLLTAYHLQNQGIKTVVIDAQNIAGGITQNTTAKISSQHNLIYQKLIKNMGEEKARQYAQANQRAIQDYLEIIERENIECDFQMKPAYLYSLQEAVPLQEETKAALRLGIDAEFTRKTELPFQVKGAVCFHNQAQFHPLLFLRAIVKGLTVYEHTRAISVQENKVVTEHGTITANKIIFTVHYPFVNQPGYYFLRMHQERSYVLALENAPPMEGMYLDQSQDGFSFRSAGNYLLFGGAGHRTGKIEEKGCYQRLQQSAAYFYPQAHAVAEWSAQDCMTMDNVPYIGAFSSSTPNWLVATGFNKWGMSSSMVAARILTDIVLENDTSYGEIFSPSRFKIAASAKNLMTDGAQAISGILLKKMQPAAQWIDDIRVGQGGIISYDGEKVGIYKDNDGECFFVSLKCPHLGCQLEWNPEELTWDCPCHGSRFDYRGNLLGGPAQENLLFSSED